MLRISQDVRASETAVCKCLELHVDWSFPAVLFTLVKHVPHVLANNDGELVVIIHIGEQRPKA